MTGNIKGEMDMKQVVANSQGGVTGLLSTIGSKVPVVKEMITKAQEVYGKSIQGKNYNDWTTGFVGRGDDNYLINPMGLRSGDINDNNEVLASYEITVVVSVKLEGMDNYMVYSRTYLPESKELKMADMNNGLEKLYNDAAKKKQQYYGQFFDTQMNYIKSLDNWAKKTPICTWGTQTGYRNQNKYMKWQLKYDNEDYSVYHLIDGDKNHEWRSYKHCTFDNSLQSTPHNDIPCWCIEFKTYYPTNPKGFTLTTGHRHGGENPKEFYLYGKKKGDKDWTLVYHADQSHLPDKAFTDKYYEIPSADRHDFSEWRFEITKVYGGDKQDYMSLGEFTFEYDK